MFDNIFPDDENNKGDYEEGLSDIVYAAISHSGIRIRKEPSEMADLATDHRLQTGEALYGTGIVSDDGNWVEVYIDNSKTGWISKNLVATNGDTEAILWMIENNITIIH